MGNVINLKDWKAKQAQIANGNRLAEWNRQARAKTRRRQTLEQIQHMVEAELGMTMLQFGERCLDVYVNDGIEPTRYQRRRGL